MLNGFVSSKAKAIASGTQGPVIDRMVEAFSKRNDFHIVDHQFFAMFGDPNKPRHYVKKQLEELVNMFGLISKELLIEKDDLALAEIYINKSLKLYKDNYYAYYLYGKLYENQNNWTKAAKNYERSIKIYPDWPETHFALCISYLKLKNPLYIEELKITLDLDPSHKPALGLAQTILEANK